MTITWASEYAHKQCMYLDEVLTVPLLGSESIEKRSTCTFTYELDTTPKYNR